MIRHRKMDLNEPEDKEEYNRVGLGMHDSPKLKSMKTASLHFLICQYYTQTILLCDYQLNFPLLPSAIMNVRCIKIDY